MSESIVSTGRGSFGNHGTTGAVDRVVDSQAHPRSFVRLGASQDDLLHGDALGVYQGEILRYPLLSAEEEVTLGRLVQRAENARKTLSDGTPVSAAERDRLCSDIERGWSARGRMIESNLRLVVSIARRYFGHTMTLGDIVQEGNVGLIKAVERYDPERGFRFSTYATWWIRQAITRGLVKRAHTIRMPVHLAEKSAKIGPASLRLTLERGREPTPSELADCVGLSTEQLQWLRRVASGTLSLDAPLGDADDRCLADVIVDETNGEPSDVLDTATDRRLIAGVLESLSPRERLVIQLRFGLNGNETRTLEQVAGVIGTSRERVRQIEAATLDKLRRMREMRTLRRMD